ncbi:MAG TPA: VCBS repeat-containing protein, partial [Thermoanaerobaculia bacterium]|nr:VCBS repeat-containing protein [Thermoanaerobaculia bacterium]
RLQAIPKTQATRIDDRHVRTMIGAIAEIEREDAGNYWVRLYEAAPSAAPAAPASAPPPPPAPPLPSPRGQLRLVDFGRGLPRSGQWREGFGVGDVNRDGHPDLVFPPARKSPGPPVVFLGDGAGNWKRWSEARFPRLAYDYGDAQVADFDGDGIADIAVAMHHRGIVALLGDGKGAFRDGSEGLDFSPRPDQLPEFSARCLRAFDWNGDGRTDLVAIGEGPVIPMGGSSVHGSTGVVVYENLGGGRWKAHRSAPRRDAPFGSSAAVGDFDGDGRLDLVIASGILGSRELLAFGEAGGGWRSGSIDSLPSEGYFRAVAAADLDGDGVDDAIVGGTYLEGDKWVPSLDAFLSRDHGKRWERRTLAREGEIAAVAAAPVAGAGSPVLVVATTSLGKVLAFLADRKEGIVRAPVSVPDTGCSGSAVQLADLDGDGRVEIVAAYADEPDTGAGRCSSQGMVNAFRIELPR